MILVLLCYSKEVSRGVYSGVLFATKCLIPTLFPFFVIGDMISSFGLPFDRFLKKRGIYVIVIGLLCGFPHGAKCATKLFENGEIDKSEYERLLILSNNPSLAFVVAGIGAGMLGNVTYGAILFISLLLSVLSLSKLIKPGVSYKERYVSVKEKKFNLIESIKNAGLSSITVASFIVFFYGLIELISALFGYGPLSVFMAVLLEISTGAKVIASNVSLPVISKMTMLGFTAGFSSLSVFMQCSAFTSKVVNRKKLLLHKILQGLFSAIYAFLLTFIYKKWLF